jgi:TRAP-type mannitol/chloroaromatic compound transport system permease small subunit
LWRSAGFGCLPHGQIGDHARKSPGTCGFSVVYAQRIAVAGLPAEGSSYTARGVCLRKLLDLADKRMLERTMNGLLAISRMIDAINLQIGKKAAWLILLAVIVATVNAIVRKLFNMSSNAWLELQWMLFGAVFLLCASWTMQVKEHIRIDIVNSHLPKRVQQWIELIGHVFFLMPFCLLMVYHSWPFFVRSYAINEQSMSAGGLAQWPAKGLVVIGFVMLSFQGVSEIIKQIAIMRGDLEDEDTLRGHAAAAEAEAQRLLEQAKEQGLVS